MPALRLDRHLAINLRKQGKSYSEISKELGIPESTMGYWFRGNQWSEEIKKKLIRKAQILAVPKLRLMSEANKRKWEAWHEECRQKAINEFPALKQDLLFVAGLMLYWGEGDKVIKNGKVRIANSDPEVLRIFYAFLKDVLLLPVEKIYMKLIIYPDLDEQSIKKFWSKLLNIPLSQFKKTVTIQGRHPKKRLSYGIGYIEVVSRELKEKIFTWIRLYQEHFIKRSRML
ncbi:MAG: Uncharacterized protein G01um10147_1020 [Microgenomates group bacterium Gr01-1014_7]|nr:MAG: Uncharacterized protein G01um10147_1020 [Microgenomates group bacterium Gr01-1014_7]